MVIVMMASVIFKLADTGTRFFYGLREIFAVLFNVFVFSQEVTRKMLIDCVDTYVLCLLISCSSRNLQVRV